MVQPADPIILEPPDSEIVETDGHKDGTFICAETDEGKDNNLEKDGGKGTSGRYATTHLIAPSELLRETLVSEGNPYWCYILRNKQNRYRQLTYNGSTNNPKRRLRQHNCEITGGARYTTACSGGWEFYAMVTGFVDHKNALSCEWIIKHTNGKPGKRPPEHCGVIGRIIGLNRILQLPKWTSKCTVENKDVQYSLYLADDVVAYMDFTKLPANITFAGKIPDFS